MGSKAQNPYLNNRLQDKSVSYFAYKSPKHRVLLNEGDLLPNAAYCFEIERHQDTLHLAVSKQSNGVFLTPTIVYRLTFKHPIGKGIKAIVCNLWTNSGLDIPIAWDAIEYSIREYSNYHSLMDIYGHFTEPHPIFSLACSVKTHHDDPIVRFAEYFSHFKNTMIELPAERLKQIMGLSGPVDFLEEVKNLRQLRFDVRVHETNLTIPKGMFRCCYPFALGSDKQVSVSWKDLEYGNRSLVL